MFSSSIRPQSTKSIYLESNKPSIDDELVKAYQNQSYTEAVQLIKRGADSLLIIEIDKERIIDICCSSFFNLENQPKEAIVNCLRHVIQNDLSFDLNQIPDELFSSIFVGAEITIEEANKKFSSLLNTLRNLPLPYLAILEKESEVLDAVVEQGVNYEKLIESELLENVDLTWWPISFEEESLVGNEAISKGKISVAILSLALFSSFLKMKDYAALDLLLKFGFDLSPWHEQKEMAKQILMSGHKETSIVFFEAKKRAEEMAEARAKFFGSSLPFKSISVLEEPLVSYVAIGGNVEVLQWLVDHDYDVNTEEKLNIWLRKRNLTPFEAAIMYHQFKAAHFLIKNGVDFDPELKDKKSRATYKAIVLNGDQVAIQFLLDLGCPLEFEEPIFESLEQYSTAIDPDANMVMTEDVDSHREVLTHKYSLLSMGVSTHDEEKIRFALEKGFSINDCTHNLFWETWNEKDKIAANPRLLSNSQMLDLFLELGGDLSLETVQNALLNLAAREALEEEFEKLLELIPQPLSISNPQALVYNTCVGGSAEILRALIKLGLDFNIVFSEYENRTPLFIESNAEFVELLIEQGLDVNYADANGQTPLFGADSEVAMVLVDHGADVNYIDLQGETPLFHAYNAEIAKVLLENGADLNHKNFNGESPFFNHTFDGGCFEYLVEQGLDINERNKDGQTPLMVRALKSAHEVQYLLEAGADLNCRDQEGKTALDLLLEKRKETIEKEGFWDSYSSLRETLQLLGYKR
ncbi:MAG: hypothetical protein S4CHLAM6_04430 [Chlamydiae bacterium]|nr:hypothetical protein [Chlamydiota bacterium]